MDRLRPGYSAALYFRAGGFVMMRKLFWIVTATVLGLAYVEFARSLRERRIRLERKEALARWEDEGGSGPNA